MRYMLSSIHSSFSGPYIVSAKVSGLRVGALVVSGGGGGDIGGGGGGLHRAGAEGGGRTRAGDHVSRHGVRRAHIEPDPTDTDIHKTHRQTQTGHSHSHSRAGMAWHGMVRCEEGVSLGPEGQPVRVHVRRRREGVDQHHLAQQRRPRLSPATSGAERLHGLLEEGMYVCVYECMYVCMSVWFGGGWLTSDRYLCGAPVWKASHFLRASEVGMKSMMSPTRKSLKEIFGARTDTARPRHTRATDTATCTHSAQQREREGEGGVRGARQAAGGPSLAPTSLARLHRSPH